jgi:oligoribonuclease
MSGVAKYLWIDLETTGLDPHVCKILECAAIVTDAELNEIGQPYTYVLGHAPSDREDASELVQRMHTENGLWDESEREDDFDVFALDDELRLVIHEHEWADEKPILAGATVHFDRAFLAAQTRVVEYLHYRQLDVRSLTLAHLDVTGTKFASAGKHRALADIRESIEQARVVYAAIRRGAR